MKVSTSELISLIQQHSDWMEANDIAEYFDVSTRTIRNRIRDINTTYPNLIVSSYKGYKFNESDYSDDFYESDDELSERAEFVIRKLISTNKPISVYDLADEMSISDSSFERALKIVKDSLSNFDLSIDRKRNKISILGKERKKRKLINFLISKENQGNFFIDSTISSDFISNDIDVEAISKELKNIFDKHSIFVNDYGFNTILFHLAIMLDRLITGKNVCDEKISVDDVNSPIMHEIKLYLENKYNISLPLIELHYLSIIINNNSNDFDFKNINLDNISNYIEKEYIDLAKNICNDLIANYCLDPFDENFMVNLTVHLRNLIIRVKNETYTHNPLAINFKNQFPFIFDMAAFIAKELNDYLNVRVIDDEIAFIAFHIGSYLETKKITKDKINVCYIYSDYHGYHLDTLSKIKSHFDSDIYISSIIGYKDFTTIKNGTDLIISTCQLDSVLAVVEIGMLLSDKNITDIRTAIDLIKINRKKASFRKDLDHFIGDKLFKKEFYCQDNFEMINVLSKECIELKLCDSNYTEEVLEREKLTSTSLRNGIAIPHSLKANSRKSFISVVVNKKKMLWGNNYVNLIIMIGTSLSDREKFKNVYNQLVEALYDPANVRLLTKCETYEDFLDKIINLI